MEPLAKLWTWTGHAFIPLAVGWAVFVRGGLDGSIPPEGALISRGYWGLLLSLASAALLTWSCALYIRASTRRSGTASVPPNMTFETETDRNALVSWGTAAVFGLSVLCAMAIFGVRYGDSRIHAWNGKQPLADGFLASRREAYRLGCSHQPCFSVGERLDGSGKPLAGINEYVLYLTDGVLVLAATVALTGGLVLVASFLTQRARTPFESDPGGA